MRLTEELINSFTKNSKKNAVIYEGNEYSYEDFLHFIFFRISEVKQYDLKEVRLISVESSDWFEHWISTLACLFLGMLTTPFKSKDGLPEEFHGIKNIGFDEGADIKVTHYTKITQLPSTVKLPINLKDLDGNSLARIFFTSGTTGTKKSIGITSNQIYSRLKSRERFFSKSDICLSLMPPFSTLGFHFQLGQWLMGGKVCLDKDFEFIKGNLVSHKFDYIVGSPHQFTSLVSGVENLPHQINTNIDEIIISGGETTKILKEKLLKIFYSKVICLFGASETGYWSKHDVTENHDYSNIGIFDEGTNVEVDCTDDEVGILKVKNQHMVTNYLNSAGKEFKDGWFYPGDKSIQKDNQIYLLGRDDSVVNVGGIKISPQVIDDFVCTLEGVKDAACFWIKDKYSYNELWVAVVTDESMDINSVFGELTRKFGVSQGPKRVIPVQMIPRTYSGKPQRNLMSEKVTEQINLLKLSQNQNIRD